MPKKPLKTILTIAGSDPSGGAGVQSDLKTFDAMGARGVSAIAALTAQNRIRVKATLAIPPRFLIKQIETLLEESGVDAVKIGMTGSGANVAALIRLFKRRRFKNIVLDPVMRSTSGATLIDKKGMATIKRLLPLVTIVTPNLAEAAILSGVGVKDIRGMEDAARRIHSLGAPFVLVKGGHLKGAPLDALFDGKGFHYFKGRRIKAGRAQLHGTGCLLSAAIAACLARGLGVPAAVKRAKAFVEETIGKRRKGMF